MAVLGTLAATLVPVLHQARESARRTACTSNLRQIGTALALYVDDFDGRLPDRRDLKQSLPGGYRPWSTWPPSDPRSGWASVVLCPWGASSPIWQCPSVAGGRIGSLPQVRQMTDQGPASYWMWRFDRRDEPIARDNLWGKTSDQAVNDLRTAANPLIGVPDGPSDVELAVDPYFPRTAPGVPSEMRGLSVHFGGRNRLSLDGHVKYLKDGRTG